LLEVAVGRRRPDREDGVGIGARSDRDDESEVGDARDPELEVEAPRREQVGPEVDKEDDEIELPGADG
jgi:hypothetical protein